MRPKFVELSPELFDYVCQNASRANDSVLGQLRSDSERLGDISRMLISEEQGNFMSLLVAAIGARSAIEVGTFTGYSSICIARGLPANGRLTCVDSSEEWTSIARRYWKEAGVADKIDLRIGDGKKVLSQLRQDEVFDFAFVDADKTGYDNYFEMLLPRIRPNGLLLFDNMVDHGRVLAPAADDENARALDALNRKLRSDPRVESVLVSIADGLNVCRKLPAEKAE